MATDARLIGESAQGRTAASWPAAGNAPLSSNISPRVNSIKDIIVYLPKKAILLPEETRIITSTRSEYAAAILVRCFPSAPMTQI